MNPSEIDVKAQHLHAFLQGLPTFPDVSEVFEPYGHMGATLTDAVLQPGLNYERAVKPRVAQVLALYPEAKTTGAFKAALDVEGEAHVLNVANARKHQSLRSKSARGAGPSPTAAPPPGPPPPQACPSSTTAPTGPARQRAAPPAPPDPARPLISRLPGTAR